MIDPRGFLVWAMKVSGITPDKPDAALSRPAQATVLLLVDGYSTTVIAREMNISAHQVAQYVRETVSTLSAQEWTQDETALFEHVAQKLKGEETVYDHFAALLDAIRNSQDPTPRTIEYDANGRAIGGRSPLVDVDIARAACRGIREFPSKMKSSLTYAGCSP